jgi:hypothetical protein
MRFGKVLRMWTKSTCRPAVMCYEFACDQFERQGLAADEAQEQGPGRQTTRTMGALAW